MVLDLYRAALEAVEPAAAVQAHLRRVDRTIVVDGRVISVPGRLFVVGAGKAAVSMACGVEAACADLIDRGLVITKDGHATGLLPSRIGVREAAHPIPDARGVAATRELLELVAAAGPDDVVLALISGGGSALLEAPRAPVTLEDMAHTTDLLLRAGAPIQDLNAVRIPLSLVKGGGLRRTAGQATVATLILSDVLGNDPHVIASGPTVPGAASGSGALHVLRQYGILDRALETVLSALTAQPAQTGVLDVSRDTIVIVADNSMAGEAARRRAEERGHVVDVAWTDSTGEARELGRRWVEACRAAPSGTEVLLGGGEATVTVRGDGIGGRNTEFALAAALALEACNDRDWVVASLATDGQDGLADAAGAIADGETVSRAREQGIDPVQALNDNDSARVFEKAGGLVQPGPTGTNVNDLYFAVRRR